MTIRPIIFSALMVRALLDGRKTQTRRIVKWLDGNLEPKAGYSVGDRLWVRETWAHDAQALETCRVVFEDAYPGGITYGPYYRATETAPDTLRWRSPIHMPRWASRLTLTVTAVKVERLQDLSEDDARAEGIAFSIDRDPIGPCKWASAIDKTKGWSSARAAYNELWNYLHGPEAWAQNPWVTAISFTVEKKNIDV